MKKITLIGLSLCLANMVIGHAHAEEKWTYDKAMESHKKMWAVVTLIIRLELMNGTVSIAFLKTLL